MKVKNLSGSSLNVLFDAVSKSRLQRWSHPTIEPCGHEVCQKCSEEFHNGDGFCEYLDSLVNHTVHQQLWDLYNCKNQEDALPELKIFLEICLDENFIHLKTENFITELSDPSSAL